jgi:hypothetical protein
MLTQSATEALRSHLERQLREMAEEFIIPIKTNRRVALSLEEKRTGDYERVGSLELEPNSTRRVYLEQVPFPLLLCKQVLKNEDGSEDVLYLVSSDPTLDYDGLTTIYQRRWKVEEYHKSLKSNASLEKSPTKKVRTQTNHVFSSIYAFVKLERLKLATKMNHFVIRSVIYLKAVRASYEELRRMRLADVGLIRALA